MKKDPCSDILEKAFLVANASLDKGLIADQVVAQEIADIITCTLNRAGARFILAATLAKTHKPGIDIRKPFIQAYDGVKKANAYPGRQYDERYIFEFITRHRLPCSSTTAFLTPAFRTKNIVLDKKKTSRQASGTLSDHLTSTRQDS